MERLGRTKCWGLVAVGCALAVAGCGSTDAGTLSSPVTSVMSPVGASTATSATPGATESGNSAQSRATASSDSAARAEAEMLFRKYQASWFKWQQAGGANTMPSDLAAITADPLRSQTAALLADQRKSGWRMGDPIPTVFVARAIELEHGAAVALSTCVDGRLTPTLRSNKVTGHGSAVAYHSYFRRVEGSLKYFYTAHKIVNSCEGFN